MKLYNVVTAIKNGYEWTGYDTLNYSQQIIRRLTMNLVDIKAHIKSADSSRDKYLVRCVIPETYLEEKYGAFNSICQKSKDFDDFLNLYIESDTFKYSQGAYELYKKFFAKDLWLKLRGFLGDKCRNCISDVGSLKIGNDVFSMFISNGYGDGVTRYAIFDCEPEWSDWFGNSLEMFEVKEDNSVFVYYYDCGNDKTEPIPKGKYLAKSYEGLVLIYKYADVKEIEDEN